MRLQLSRSFLASTILEITSRMAERGSGAPDHVHTPKNGVPRLDRCLDNNTWWSSHNDEGSPNPYFQFDNKLISMKCRHDGTRILHA